MNEGRLRGEIAAAAWESLSALLLCLAIAPGLLHEAPAFVIFVVGLGLSAALAGPFVRLGGVGQTAIVLLRSVLWGIVPLLTEGSLSTVLVAGGFGVMGGVVRRSFYGAFGPRLATDRPLRDRLAEAGSGPGIVAGHIVLLFSLAFLRVTTAQVRGAALSLLPWLAAGSTIIFATVVRFIAARIAAALRDGASDDDVRRGTRTAERAPRTLAAVNFALWGTSSLLASAIPLHAQIDPIVLVALWLVGVLLGWGASVYQLAWHRAILAPLLDLLRKHPAAPEPSLPKPSLRARLVRDFGVAVALPCALFLFATLALYGSLAGERGVAVQLSDVLLLGFAVLVIAAGSLGIIDRAAQDLARPIDRLAKAAGEVAWGNTNARLEAVDAPREIVDLGLAAETMRHALARTIGELDSERRGLEERVVTRTSELRGALDDLGHAQAALLHGEKMASLGSLVAGVAHEINNPLSAIGGSVAPVPALVTSLRDAIAVYEAALEKLPIADQSRIRAAVTPLEVGAALDDLEGIAKVIERATARGARIVDGLRRFSRASEDAAPSHLEAGIEETLTLLGPMLRDAGVTVEKELAPLPEVTCRAGEMNQVFMNLLSNGVAAVQGRDPRVLRVTAEDLGGRVRIVFDDSGPGVPASVRGRVFDPFFTTKPAGSGTGLGLSISAQIVARHGGTLTVGDAPGGGARFVVEVPIAGHLGSKRESG